MLRIAICDDEMSTVENVEKHISTFGKLHGFNVETFKFYDGESLISSDIKFDIIFLDCQMNGKFNSRKRYGYYNYFYYRICLL